jgi:hypothetical protein
VSSQVRVETGQYKKKAISLKGKKRIGIKLLPVTSETSFTEWRAKPSRAPTLICLPSCAILASSKVGI